MSLTIALGGLLLPVLLGIVATRLSLFSDPERAIDALNRYALYFGFPVLVLTGMANASFRLPTDLAFWVLVPVSLLLVVLVLRLLSQMLGVQQHAGSLVLATVFGNVAYLGLPVTERVLGAQTIGLASLVMSIHIVFSLLVGPYLLVRWSNRTESTSPFGKVLRQPLFWAPLLGLAARMLPTTFLAPTRQVLQPIGASAAPVALFMLGIYLFVNRHQLRTFNLTSFSFVAGKLFLLPLITFGLVVGAQRAGLNKEPAQVILLLSAMPTAVTTFALARELKAGQEQIARAIVASTLAAVVVVPLVSLYVLQM